LTKVNAVRCQLAYSSTVNAISGARTRKDTVIPARMVQIYCDNHHRGHDKGDIIKRGILQTINMRETRLCLKCARLLTHGLVKLVNCLSIPNHAASIARRRAVRTDTGIPSGP
jgi:hypothetical protein